MIFRDGRCQLLCRLFLETGIFLKADTKAPKISDSNLSSDFKFQNAYIHHQTLMINRRKNVTAHSLARMSRSSTSARPTFTFTHSSHDNHCQVKSLLLASSWEPFELLHVRCSQSINIPSLIYKKKEKN